MAGLDLVKQRVSHSGEWVQDRWGEFRARSGFYQARVAVVLAYVLVVVATVLLAPPAPPTFQIKVGQVPWGFSQRTYVDVTNLDLGDVEEGQIEVHGRVLEFDGKESRGPWFFPVKLLKEGEQVRVWPEALFDRKKRPAGNNLQVERVILREDGDVLFDHVPEPE